jgi:hypothetical protein
MARKAQPTTTPMNDTDTEMDNSEVVRNLIVVWDKIQGALRQEAEGRKLWRECTLELIDILHAQRQRHPSDQSFGKWLTINDFGEDRLPRHDRIALLNMAEHPELTREVLEQTHRRSYQLIWREEIQPRLPNARQPTDGETPTNNAERSTDADSTQETPIQPTEGEASEAATAELSDDHKASAPNEAPKTEASKPTRRARTSGPSKNDDPWLKDRNKFYSNAKSIAHGAKELMKTLLQCNAEQTQNYREHADTVFLKELEEADEALSFVCERLTGSAESAEAEADELAERTGRVRGTPAPVQPSI